MITKAIIKKCIEHKTIIEDEEVSYWEYKMQIPIFEGYNDNYVQPSDDQMTSASAITLPYGNYTRYSENDLVWIAIEDYDMSTAVILGLIPISIDKDVNNLGGGANPGDQTTFALTNVDTIKFGHKGTASLPKDTNLLNSEGEELVSPFDFECLQQCEDVLQFQININKASIRNFFNNVLHSQVEVSDEEIQFNDAIWGANSPIAYNGKFKFVHNHNDDSWSVYDINGAEPVELFRRIKEEQLLSRFGLTVPLDKYGTGTEFSIDVKLGALSIENGGTGATSEVEARANLHVKQDILISATDFDNLATVEPNTIYYIYDSADIIT